MTKNECECLYQFMAPTFKWKRVSLQEKHRIWNVSQLMKNLAVGDTLSCHDFKCKNHTLKAVASDYLMLHGGGIITPNTDTHLLTNPSLQGLNYKSKVLLEKKSTNQLVNFSPCELNVELALMKCEFSQHWFQGPGNMHASALSCHAGKEQTLSMLFCNSWAFPVWHGKMSAAVRLVKPGWKSNAKFKTLLECLLWQLLGISYNHSWT